MNDPHTSAAKQKGRSVRCGNAPYRAAFVLLRLLPVFDATSPDKGGNLNCAGAHHGNLTPPRNARSCVQEYHFGLTGSWRAQLAKAVLA